MQWNGKNNEKLWLAGMALSADSPRCLSAAGVQQVCHQQRQADTLLLSCSIDSILERRLSSVVVADMGLMMNTNPKPVVL
jgi:hypothetical protein